MYVVISDLFVETLNGVSCSHRPEPKGLLGGKLFESLFLGNEMKAPRNLEVVHDIKGKGKYTLLAQAMSGL